MKAAVRRQRVACAQRKKLQGLRQPAQHRHCNQQRHDAAKQEHGSPTEGWYQPGGDEAADRGAGRESHRHAHHGADTAAPGAEFTDQRGGIWNDRTHADTGNEAQPQQLLDGLRKCCRDRHQRKEQRGADQHRATSDAVRQHAEQQRSEQHTEVCRGKDAAERRTIDAPVRNHGGRHITHRLHIEAVHQQAKQAQCEHPNLRAHRQGCVPAPRQRSACPRRRCPWRRCAPRSRRLLAQQGLRQQIVQRGRRASCCK